MPIKSISSDAFKVTIDFGTGPIEALYLSHGGQPGSANHKKNLFESIQALLETRINVDDLPLDEETLPFAGSPGEDMGFGEVMFYEKNGPNTFLVSRTAVVDIDATTWDGEKYIPVLRRPDRSRAP